MSNESETIEQVFERCTSTDFSSRDREEIFRAMQEYADLQNAEMKAQSELNAKTLKSQNIAILRHLADKGEMVAVLSDTLTTLKAFLPDAWATINHVESTVQKFTSTPKHEFE